MSLKMRPAGEITIALRNTTTGLPASPFRFMGCANPFVEKLAIEQGENRESCSGQWLVDETWEKSKSGSLDITVTDWTPKNVAIALGGTIQEAGSAESADGETLPDGVVAGDVWHIGAAGGQTHFNVTGVSITDSASPPATLTLDENYSLDEVMGTIKFLDVDGFTQPFQIPSYGYTDLRYISIFTATQNEYIMRYNWKNMQDGGAKGGAEYYRVKFKAIPTLTLVSPDIVPLEMSADLLVDSNKPSDGELGQFGRLLM